MIALTTAGIDLLRHSIREHRRGKYMKLLGDDYARTVRTNTVNDLIIGTLQDSEAILEAAFDEYPPLPDEVILSVLHQYVLTDNRLFLGTDDGSLYCPPIPISDIRSYEAILGDQTIALKSGETIEREVSAYPKGWLMKKVILMDSDPALREELHGPSMFPVKRATQPSEAILGKSAHDEAAIKRIDILAEKLAAGSEVHSWGLCVWDTAKLKVSNAFYRWTGRALLGVVAEGIQGDRALGLAIATKDGQVLIVGLGKTLADSPIDPLKIDGREKSCDLIVKVPSSELAPNPTLNTMVVDGVDLEFPDCFVLGNKTFPRKAMEARFGLERDSEDDAMVTGESPLSSSEVFGCLIVAAVIVAAWVFYLLF